MQSIYYKSFLYKGEETPKNLLYKGNFILFFFLYKGKNSIFATKIHERKEKWIKK